MQTVADMVKHVVGEDIEIETVTHSGIGMIRVDAGKLEQVILNLVINARDAMPEGGKLTIETANVAIGDDSVNNHFGVLPGNYVTLTVSDNGCGMDADTCKHCFDPFFTTKAAGKGAGLGLSTVYGIVTQHGGNISVYSELERGTTFKIYFPLVRAAEDELLATAPATAGIHGRGELILVVEDEPSLRSVIAEYLSGSGFRVVTAGAYDEALQAAKNNRENVALLLTDVVLPGKSGREIAETIKSEMPHIRVMYMSGYTFGTILQDGIQADGTHFIQKPFTQNALLSAIHTLLQGDLKNGSSEPVRS